MTVLDRINFLLEKTIFPYFKSIIFLKIFLAEIHEEIFLKKIISDT